MTSTATVRDDAGDHAVADGAASSPSTWLKLLVPDARYRRRASDVVRVVIAASGILVVALVTRNDTRTEGAFTSFVAALPDWARAIFATLYSVGCVTVLVIVGLAAVRRWKLAASLVLAAAISTVGAGVLYALLDSGAGAPAALDDLRSFPLRRLAVIVALLFAGRHFLTRPVRHVADFVVFVTIVGALFAPEAFPLDVVAAFLVGWGSAALTGLAIGSPEGQATTADVLDALADLGLTVVDVRLAPHQVWGDARYEATTPTGEVLDVVVFGRDADDAQLVAKTWRTVLYRDSGPTVTFSRQHRVEQLAFMLVFASQRGANVPTVVAAGMAGAAETGVVVTRRVPGTTLDDLDPDHVDDAALRELWRSIGVLRAARLAHGGLEPGRLVLDGPNAWVVDFTNASSSAPKIRLDADLAELLVSMSIVVGVPRAVATLEDTLGVDALMAVLPVLQPAALSAGTRKHVDGLKELLGEIRTATAAAAETDLPPPPAALRRVTVGNVVMLGLTFVGVALLLGMFADIDWQELKSALETAVWGWVVVGAVLSFLPALTDSLSSLGGLGPQLPLAPLVMMNLGSKFINIAVPATVGQAAVSIRFAERQGIEPGAAISGGIVISVTGFVIQATVLITGLLLGVVDLNIDFSLPSDQIGLFLFVAAGIVLVVVFAVRGSIRLRTWFRTTVQPQIAEFRGGLRAIATEPKRILLLIGGNLGSQFLYGAVLYSCLLAYGVDGRYFFLAVLANTGASLLGGLMPIPGGVGVWEGTAAAILTAGGVDPSLATVAVLTHRMLTFYLPPIYGWFAFTWLRRRDYL
jgi:uncharacterized protein (TIRG00374 family)